MAKIRDSYRRAAAAVTHALVATVLIVALAQSADAPLASQEPQTLAFINGRWFDGRSFHEDRYYSVQGVLRSAAPALVDRTIDLEGAWVVPAFGEAHNHNIADADGLDATLRSYLSEGVFYVKTMSNLPRLTAPIREKVNRPDSVDVLFANGGLTGSGGHPIRLRELLLDRGSYPGFTRETLKDHGYFVIDSLDDLEAKWQAILDFEPDLIKTFLLNSEEFAKRRDDPEYFGRKGLDPGLLPAIVARSRAAGLRVSVHVETSTDFHHAVRAGADEIAHLPGHQRAPQIIDPRDAAEAAERGVVVVTTVGLARRDRRDAERYEAIRSAQRSNLQLLHESGVAIAIGSDNFATTSVAEATYIDELGVFDRSTLLRLLSETTPRSIFPERMIGVLADGYEASFLALDANPLEDFGNIRKIRLRVKEGRILDL